MSLLEPNYSLLTLLTVLIVGILIGRLTAARSDPRRAEDLRRRERAAKADAAGTLARLPEHARERIERLVAEGQLIDAVRACRSELGLSLKEARDVVGLLRLGEGPAGARVAGDTVRRGR